MTDLLVRDRTREARPGTETRTVVFDLPAAWLLHSLFRSKAYRSHTSGVATVEVVVATDEGCAVGTIVLTDDAPPNDRGYDESVSSSEPRLTDKVSITFWANDPDPVVPAIHAALERAIQALW